jgi:hypothetical protein
MFRDIESVIKNPSDPEFKNVNIFLMEPKQLFYESVEFKKCKKGVEWGTTEYTQHDKKGLRSLNLTNFL